MSQPPPTVEPAASAPPPPPPRRRLAALWTVLRWLAVAAIVWFVAKALAGGIREVNWAGLRVHWGWLSLSPLPVVVALTMEAWAVRLAYRSFGASFALPRTLFLVALPQLGKYLPGKVLALAGHVALAKGYGASGKVIASVLVLLQFLAILASILLSLASLALSTAEAPALRVIKFVLLASAAGGVVLLLTPRLYLWVINQGLRLVRRQPLRSTLDVGTMLKLAALLTARTLAFSLGFALMAQAVVPLPLAAVTDLVGAFCLANLVGYIALFAPAGIGVREWMYVILLGAVMSRPDAALVTALARVWQTVMDLVIVALGFGAVAIWPDAKPPPLPAAEDDGGQQGEPRLAAELAPRSRGPLDLPGLPPLARRYVLLAAGVVAAVYLLSVNNAWWPTPDSALYQGLARSMVQGRGYVFNGQAHTTVTPGLPLILAGLRLAFGEGYWAANLFMTLCGLGGLLLAWMSLRRLTDEWTALLTVVACAASYECFHDSHAILTDAPFFLLFWAVTYASLRLLAGGWAWMAPTAALAALALAVRAPGIIVLGPLAAALLVQRAGAAAGWARRLAAAAVVLAVPLLTAGGLYLLARSYSDQPSEYVNSPNVRVDLLTRLLYIPRSLPVIPDEIAECLTGQAIPVLGVALLALILAGGVLLWRGGNRLAPVVCGLCLLVSAALAGPLNIRARYLLPVSPLLILMGLYGVVWAARRALAWRGRAVGPAGPWRAAALFVGIVVAINLPTVAREAFRYDLCAVRTGEFYRQIEEGHYADLPALAEFLRQGLPPGQTAIVRGDRVNELHLLSGVHTVPFKKVHVWNPWSAEHAEEIYADLRGRPDVPVIIHDRGGLNERFNERLSELLAGDPDLRSAGFRGELTEVYVRRPTESAPAVSCR